MMKRFFIALAALLLFAACEPKQPEKPKLDVTGAWELVSAVTKVNVAGEDVSIYLQFASDATFVLYQKVGAGRYTRFSGTWAVDQELKQLSGSYESGAEWGPYGCTCENGVLTLAFPDGKETDTYNRIDEIPSAVTANVY